MFPDAVVGAWLMLGMAVEPLALICVCAWWTVRDKRRRRK